MHAPAGAALGEPPRRAFTLIELLVVVAIIAVLISILLPALGAARKQARTVLCNTNLRNIGQASYFYAQQNRDTIVRSESGAAQGRLHFVCTLLPGLGYDGKVNGLWAVGQQGPILEACAKTASLQCPSFPVPQQVLDYVVNAFPIPYTRRNINQDDAGGGQANGEDRYTNEGNYDSVRFFRLADLGKISPAQIVHITEAHSSLKTDDLTFHDTFFTSQLPFGANPRMCNDKRHTSGVNSVFFDGHAETVPWAKMDAAWPNKLGVRLRVFTVVPIELDR